LLQLIQSKPGQGLAVCGNAVSVAAKWRLGGRLDDKATNIEKPEDLGAAITAGRGDPLRRPRSWPLGLRPCATATPGTARAALLLRRRGPGPRRSGTKAYLRVDKAALGSGPHLPSSKNPCAFADGVGWRTSTGAQRDGLVAQCGEGRAICAALSQRLEAPAAGAAPGPARARHDHRVQPDRPGRRPAPRSCSSICHPSPSRRAYPSALGSVSAEGEAVDGSAARWRPWSGERGGRPPFTSSPRVSVHRRRTTSSRRSSAREHGPAGRQRGEKTRSTRFHCRSSGSAAERPAASCAVFGKGPPA